MSSKKPKAAAKAGPDDKQPVLSRFFSAAPAASSAAAASAPKPAAAPAAKAIKARAPKRKGAEAEAEAEAESEAAASATPAAAASSSRAKRPRATASAAASGKLREVVDISDDEEEPTTAKREEQADEESKAAAQTEEQQPSKARASKKSTVAISFSPVRPPASAASAAAASTAAAVAPVSPARSTAAFFAPASPSSASAAASPSLAAPFRASLLPAGQKLSLPSTLPPRDPRVHQSFVDGILAREMEEEEARAEERRKEEERIANEKASRFIKGSASASAASSAAAAASSSSAAAAAAPAAASSNGVSFHTPASFDLARWSGIPGTTESTKFTPLEQQVLALKRAHPDVLLLVEVGYKYRFFGRDAEVAGALLDIVAHPGSQHLLTASIPTFRVYIHIKRLVEAGLKVGVVRQTETATGKKMEKASRARGAKSEKGSASAPLSLFSRGISELYTKATSVPELGDEQVLGLGSASSRFLMVLFEENISNLSTSSAPDSGIGSAAASSSSGGGGGGAQKVKCNLMALDPSSGEVVWDEFETDYLRGEIETRLQQIDPIEILVSADPTKLSSNTSQLLLAFANAAASKDGAEANDAGVRLEKLDARRFKFDYPTAAQTVRRFFEGLGPAAPTEAASSSAAAAAAPAGKRGKKTAKKEVHVLSDDDEDFATDAAPAAAAASSSASSSSLASLALSLPKGALICLGILIPYLQSFAGGGLDRALRLTANFRRLGSAGRGDREQMELDGLTLHNLEVIGNQEGGNVGSLLWMLSHTKTAFGARMLRKWVLAPLASRPAITARLEAVGEVLEDGGSGWSAPLITLLHQLPDLERGMARIQMGQCKPVEFLRILRAFERVSLAFPDASTIAGLRSELLREMFSAVDYPAMKSTVAHFLGALNAAAVEAGQTADFFDDPSLYPAVQRVKDRISEIESGLQQELVDARRKLGLDYGALQFLTVNNVEFLIEVKNTDLKRAPKEWAQINATKVKTRFHTPRVVDLLDQLQLAREELKIVAGESWRHFLGQFISGGSAAETATQESKDDEIDATFSTPAASAAAAAPSNPLTVGAQGGNYLIFRSVISCLAKLDCIVSLAAVAALPGYVRPMFEEGDEEGVSRVEIKAGRHPMIEAMSSMAGAAAGSFVPNDIKICSGAPVAAGSASASASASSSAQEQDQTRFYVVSGANMGGKSTYIRSMALLIILAQIGSYVPADSMRITGPPIDAVYTRMGARDLITKGQSTFHVELSETRSILARATPRSFVILDELGRGTSTSDGTAIALATSEYIIDELRCPTILVTHYPVLGGLATKYPGVVQTWHMAYIEEDGEEVAAPVSATATAAAGAGAEGVGAEATVKVPRITFLFKLVPGMSPSSFGLNVGRMAHLPSSVLALAAVKSAEMRRQNQLDEERKENAKKRQAWRIMQELLQGTSTDPPAIALQRFRQLMPAANTAASSKDATQMTL